MSSYAQSIFIYGSNFTKKVFSPFLQFWILSQGFLLHVIQPSFWNMKLLNSKMLKVFYLCYTCKWISQVEGGGGTIWSPSDISSYFNPLFHSNSYSALDYESGYNYFLKDFLQTSNFHWISFKLIFFFCRLSIETTVENKKFLAGQIRISHLSLTSQRFKKYLSESDIPLDKWRVNWKKYFQSQ